MAKAKKVKRSTKATRKGEILVDTTRAFQFFRHCTFDRAQLDEKERTVPVVFSTEHPVDRGDYDEILDHTETGLDLTRLNDAHPLLLNHDPEKQIGVVERAELSKEEKKGRAVIRFGRGDLATEIFNDVKDGIRKHMSVGYERLRTMSTETAEGGRRSIRFAWRPFELSVVPVPADPNAGIGRSANGKNLENRSMTNWACCSICRDALSALNCALGGIEECGKHPEAIAPIRDGIASLAIVIEDANYATVATAAETVEACRECADYCAKAIESLNACADCAHCVEYTKCAIERAEEAIESCRENAGIDGDAEPARSETEEEGLADDGDIIEGGGDGENAGGVEGEQEGTAVRNPPSVDNPANNESSANAQITMSQAATATPQNATATASTSAVDERQAERNRVKEIRAYVAELAKTWAEPAMVKIREEAEKAVDQGTESRAFAADLLPKLPGMAPAPMITAESLGMSQRDISKYCLTRAIQSCVDTGQKIPQGHEGDVHRAMEKAVKSVGSALGGGPAGFLVPFNMPFPDGNRIMSARDRRDLTVGTFGQGGAFVQTTILTPIIEILRNRMVCMRLGVQSMGGLEGNVAIPRQTGAATAYAAAEIATLAVSTQALDQLLLTPHRVGAVGKYSKQLLLQSSVDVENFVRDDLMKQLAIKWDYLILQGSGANNEPTGISNTNGIGSVIFGGAVTWANVIAFETALALANADMGRMAYVSTPNVRGKWKATAKIGNTFPVFIWEKGEFSDGSNDGEVNAYRAACTNQILNNQVAFGNFEDCIHALWGGFDVVVNPYTFDVNSEVQVTIATFGDVAVRHSGSFCWSVDNGNQ